MHKRKHITLLVADKIVKRDTFNSTCKTDTVFRTTYFLLSVLHSSARVGIEPATFRPLVRRSTHSVTDLGPKPKCTLPLSLRFPFNYWIAVFAALWCLPHRDINTMYPIDWHWDWLTNQVVSYSRFAWLSVFSDVQSFVPVNVLLAGQNLSTDYCVSEACWSTTGANFTYYIPLDPTMPVNSTLALQ